MCEALPGAPSHVGVSIYEPPFKVPFHVFCSLFPVAPTSATLFSLAHVLVHVPNCVFSTLPSWLVPVTSGTTCTGLHTLIRMPVLCVVFRLETGGEHPFAAPIFTIWPDLYPLLDQPLCFSPVYFLYLHPVNCVRRLQQLSWSLTHMYLIRTCHTVHMLQCLGFSDLHLSFQHQYNIFTLLSALAPRCL